MTSANIFKSSFLGVVWLFALSDSSGMSLGRPRSVALLGQPLELTVPVQFDADEKAAGLCFDADVFFGDNKLDTSQVLVTAPTVNQEALVNVRVVSRQAIDEPVVTVYLRGGCLQKSTRKFVLLADLATDLVVPALPVSVQVRPTAEKSSVPIAGALTPTQEIRLVLSQPGNLASRRNRSPGLSAGVTSNATTEGVPKSTAISSTSVVRRSRLKLAPIDLSIERDPVLKLTSQMVVVPLEDLNKRNEAVAWWQALNALPQDVLRDQARTRSLESDLKLQLDATAKNAQTLHELTARLEQVEAQKFANPVVYVLSALLLLCIVGLALMGSRLRAQQTGTSPWWRGRGQGVELEDAEDSPFGLPKGADAARKEITPSDDQTATSSLIVVSAKSEPCVTEVDIDLDLGESVLANAGRATVLGKVGAAVTDVQPLEVEVPLHRDFSLSGLDGLRSMNMQEMLDVRQQADFFMTLGQYDEAIGLLTTSIKDSGESNPLVYLELLKALHSLSRKSDYDHYRADFNARFTGHVPEYTGFSQGGNDLESYPDLLSRIAACWPSQQSLEVIEECLVRRHDRADTYEFDLDAYRDLLMLHAVASRVLSTSESGPAPFSTTKVELPQTLAASEEMMVVDFVTEPFQTVESLPEILDDPASYSIDLDLSDGASNLIDFDASHLSESAPLDKNKPASDAKD